MQKPEDYVRARVALRKALDLDPNLVNAHNWLAGVFSALGQDDDVLAQYELATRIDPLAPIINLNLAMNELEQGKTEQAEKRLLRLLQVPRPSHHPYLGLIDVYLQTGRLVEVDRIARELALAFARLNGRAWVRQLAHNFAYLGMWKQAEYWYDYLEKQFEEIYQVRFARLFLLRRQGRLEEMKEFSDRVLDSRQLSPSDLPLLFALKYGTAQSMAGEYAEAIGILGQLLSIESAGEGGLGNEETLDPFHSYAWALSMTGDTGSAEEIIAGMEDFFQDMKSKGRLHSSEMKFYFAQNALLADDMEATLDRLQLAIDAGWRDYHLLMHDPRWKSLRDNSRFQGLMESVKSDLDAQRTEVERFDAEDDFQARIDAAIAEFESRPESG
jgi:tetratricopeptide (TPR) repeat protein